MGKPFMKVSAIFNPKVTTDLKPGLENVIGEEFIFQYGWIMEDDEQFPGVWAMTCYDPSFFKYGATWTPEFDLIITSRLGYEGTTFEDLFKNTEKTVCPNCDKEFNLKENHWIDEKYKCPHCGQVKVLTYG